MRVLHPGPGGLVPGRAVAPGGAEERGRAGGNFGPGPDPIRRDRLLRLRGADVPAGRPALDLRPAPRCPPPRPAAHPPEHQWPRQPHPPPGRDAGVARPAGRRLRLPQRLQRGRLPRHHPPRRRRSRLAGHAGLRAGRPEVRPQGHGLHRGLRKNTPGDRSLPPPGRKPRRHLPRAPLRRVTKRKVV